MSSDGPGHNAGDMNLDNEAGAAENFNLEDFSVEAISSKLTELKQMFEHEICAPLISRAEKVVQENQAFEEEKRKHRDETATMDDIVQLDVGGKFFDIKRRDLCSVPESKLAKIFNGDFVIQKAPKTGRTFLDRDYTFFHIIHAYLEKKDYSLPTDPLDIKRLAHECEFYGLSKLKAEVEAQKNANRRAQ
eukprot:NODE_8005_length_729_cov_81.070957_g7753_i0.p1 GENE.NODE_8005_length_729_cov_81.070957_g7753_i0~~NODE_8005_length_729_cov_81.070957_g7753_i0.p1  ORF type:complete len:208 (-),score=64.13 NODE_8005_length_729_cov_81.070957_g7753_i0:106-675(-)